MKILLTGGAGFIGASFARLASTRGHHIAALIKPGKNPPADLSDVTWLEGSLDEAPWSEIANFRPEACVHAAWITAPSLYLDSPENERLMYSSRDFIRRAARSGVRRVIALGTCLEYQMTGVALSDATASLAPASLYARCKDTLRQWLEQDSRESGFPLCWGRVFYPYGPGEHPARLCTSLVQKLRRGEQVILKSPGSVKDYINIEDLAAALLVLVERGVSGAVNLGTGRGVTIKLMAETLEDILGRSGLICGARPAEPDPLGYVVADISRLHSLGWEPQIALRQGLSRLVRHLDK